MAIYRAQIGFAMDSALPRDVVTINPHYFGDNAQGLADALKANLLANTQVGATSPFTIKVYDAQKAPPSYPLATASSGTGFKTTSIPRELALCLSYYSTNNRPGYRGRLYIPASFCGGTPSLRPSGTQQTNAMSFKNTLAQNLPAQHNWVIYSPKRNQSDGVTDVWVDDEWDIVRSRGLRGMSRITAKVP
jgi:hypothetical protein